MYVKKKAGGGLAWAAWLAMLATLALLQGCALQEPGGALPEGAAPVQAQSGDPEVPPPAPREFRAAWVSTVANIDWPSRSNLTVAQQKAEIIAILDRLKGLNMNAVILQVRPAADAIYPSRLEPWSEYLTGTQGKAPEPFYDPLKMWITEAHARGLELHAWFNPYRARNTDSRSPLSPQHIASSHPSAVHQYGKYLWVDPGDPWAEAHTIAVFLDVVRRYDVDAVHIDDYFYPYPIDAAREVAREAAAREGAREGGREIRLSAADGAAGLQMATTLGSAPPKPASGELDFPDDASWQAYQAGGGTLARADWRRQNVNDLIERLYAGIHHEKSWVRFGISPFGIGRPDLRPPGICCFSQYDKLYANAELWLNKGWLDYLSPQLYWPIDQKPQAFGVLLDYWAGQNTFHRHLWPGLFTSRIDNSDRSWKTSEILNQIALTHTDAGKADGHAHFSIAALMQNRSGIADQLRAGPYAVPALVPATPWLGSEGLAAPALQLSRAAGRTTTTVSLTPAGGKPVARYAVWARYQQSQWRFSVVPAARPVFELADDAQLGAVDMVVVSAVDRLGNESARSVAKSTTLQPVAAPAAVSSVSLVPNVMH